MVIIKIFIINDNYNIKDINYNSYYAQNNLVSEFARTR